MRKEEKDHMSKKKAKIAKGKHLTEDDRAFIAEALQINMSFKQIAVRLDKDPTTIAKEVKTNRVFKQASCLRGTPNLCLYRNQCSQSYICPPEDRGRHCVSGCNKCDCCTEVCRKFEKEECPSLYKAPFVCNLEFPMRTGNYIEK
jgi:hypothetical protein